MRSRGVSAPRPAERDHSEDDMEHEEEEEGPFAEDKYDEEEVSESEQDEEVEDVEEPVNAQDLFDEVSFQTCPRSGLLSTS